MICAKIGYSSRFCFIKSQGWTFYDDNYDISAYFCMKNSFIAMTRPIYNEETRNPEQTMYTSKGYNHKRFNNSSEYSAMLREAMHYYDQMRPLRKKCIRDLDYYMGRQLNDEVVYNGHTMSVHDYMQMKGMAPLSSDIITDKMVTLKGLVRQQYMAPKVKAVDASEEDFAVTLSELLRQNDNNNDKPELMAEFFEHHICMGLIGGKISWTFRNGRDDLYVDKVNIFDFATPPFTKKDLEDVEFFAEAHDMTWPKLLQKFYRKPGDEEALSRIYSAAQGAKTLYGRRDTGMNQTDYLDDFLHPNVIGKYRVIEIWRKEYNRALWCHDRLNATVGFRPLKDKKAIDAENQRRREMNIRRDEYGVPILDELGNQTYYVPESELELIEYEMRIEDVWYYRFLSPNGYLLDEGLSPYRVIRDGYSFYYHPYVFLAYPCIQGEIRSFEDRIIDKQRQYNHDSILIDFIIMNSSKGALAIDTDAISDEMDWQEMAEQYVKVDGIVLYTSKNGGNVPQQIQNKSLPAGLELIMQRDRELLTTQSNVQPALQGQSPDAGTSAKRYLAEQQSSAVGVTDYVASFNNFARRLAKKQLWGIQCFYDSKRSVQVTGEDVWRYFNPETMGDIECDVAMVLDANSATIREGLKELVFQAYEKDEITFTQMLDAADFGDTAKLKRMAMEHMEEKQQIAAQQAAAGQMPTGQAPGMDARENGAHRLSPDGTGVVAPASVGSPDTSS